jgi:predicted AlkP superfamily pyrophosphatase or phosphodiesterase
VKLRSYPKRIGIPALLLAIVAGLAASPRPKPVKRGAVTNHILVISIDGLRPDAIDRYGAKTLQRLRAEGASARLAQTIYPSKTLPSHTSMVTGVTPEVHGITWNSDRTGSMGLVSSTTMFELAKSAGFTTAGFFSKSKFRHLQKPNSFDYTQAPRGLDTWLATRTVGDAVNYLHHRQPNLMFVHIAEPDQAGHSVGWMSAPYGWAVKRSDGAVEALLKAADKAFGRGEYTVIVTADHGGHGRDHGTHDERDMTIPWISWGKGVAPQSAFGDVRTTDTAATVLWLLGLPQPLNWDANAAAGAYTEAARLASDAATGATTVVVAAPIGSRQ